jgi:hypothetical protein
LELDGVNGRLHPAVWVEPLGETGAFVLENRLGKGTIVALGSFFGLAYRVERSHDFERFVYALARRARALPSLRCDPGDGETVQWRLGDAGGALLLFVINETVAQMVTFSGSALPIGAHVRDLATGAAAGEVVKREGEPSLRLQLRAGGYHILHLVDGQS